MTGNEKAFRAAYERYIEDWRVGESSIKTAWVKGRMEGKIEIAIEMLKDGEPYDKIRRYTGLTDNEINELESKSLK